MQEGTTSRLMAADRSYGEFYDFYSPEYFGLTLVSCLEFWHQHLSFCLHVSHLKKNIQLSTAVTLLNYMSKNYALQTPRAKITDIYYFPWFFVYLKFQNSECDCRNAIITCVYYLMFSWLWIMIH
jgi:hypothetical protein